MSFKTFGLRKEILQAIDEKGYTEATSIQVQAIPLILKREDLLAGAQTGTGKTASFTLPLLELLTSKQKNQKGRVVRGLILTPTRELAAQVADNIRMYGKYLPIKTQAIFGGVSISMQVKRLQSGVDILVSTPGRLLDLISQNAVDLSHVEMLVIDEADRMMDMGFIHDMKKILTFVPQNRQSLLFSATFSEQIKKLAQAFLHSPKTIEMAPQSTPNELISQTVYPVDNKRKHELLSFLISSQNWDQVLVFVRTKHKANQLCNQLIDEGISADAIHGNKTQAARMKVLQDFKRGTLRVLVATDVAARGIDIAQLSHIVNFELPETPIDYIHRIGRTGRAGNSGAAYSLVCIDEHQLLKQIERLLKITIPQIIEPGYEPDPSIPAEPIRRGRFSQTKPHRNSSARNYSQKPRDSRFSKNTRFNEDQPKPRNTRFNEDQPKPRDSRFSKNTRFNEDQPKPKNTRFNEDQPKPRDSRFSKNTRFNEDQPKPRNTRVNEDQSKPRETHFSKNTRVNEGQPKPKKKFIEKRKFPNTSFAGKRKQEQR